LTVSWYDRASGEIRTVTQTKDALGIGDVCPIVSLQAQGGKLIVKQFKVSHEALDYGDIPA